MLTADALTLTRAAALATFYTARGAAGIEPTGAHHQQAFSSLLGPQCCTAACTVACKGTQGFPSGCC